MSEPGRLRVDARRSRATCPFCRDVLAPEDEVVVCRDCDTRHHEACWDEGGVCSTCSSPTGLRRLAPGVAGSTADAPREERDAAGRAAGRRQEVQAARNRIDKLLAGLQKRRNGNPLRQWWVFLVPHVYIPLFWPFLLLGHLAAKWKTRTDVDEVVALARGHGIQLGKEQLTFLDEESAWAQRWY
jgi:hypothetical protein